MTALKVIGIILLVFLLIGFLRVGAIVFFEDELCVKLRVGAIRLTIFPKREKKEKPKKPKEEKPKEEPKEEKPKKKPSIPKPTIDDLLDLAETALSALGATVRRACKRTRIDPLELTVVLGGDDPAAIAMIYGAASAAMFAEMPKVEEKFCVPDPSLHLRMDLDAEGTSAKGRVGVSLRVCDLFAIAFTLIVPLAKWFLRFKKAHRNDQPSHKGPDAEPEHKAENDTEDKIA